MSDYLNKFKQIVEGWTNYYVRSPEIEEMAQERATICANCNFNVNGVCSSDQCEEIDGEEVCGCGCPLSKAVRSPNKQCPKGLW